MRVVTLRTLLDVSLREEQNAQSLYRSAAAQVKDGAAKRFLEALIVEERRHEEELREVATRVNDETLAIALDDAPPEEIAACEAAAAGDIEDGLSIHGLLLLALKREKRAAVVYARMADAAEDPVARSILLSLAEAEDDHARRIRAYFQLAR